MPDDGLASTQAVTGSQSWASSFDERFIEVLDPARDFLRRGASPCKT